MRIADDACKIGEGRFVWSRRAESIEQEEKLDGIYVLRTSEPVERLSAEETLRSYKRLAEVERAFRCLKGIDLLVRPIRHRTEDRVPAHIFLCVLAYYVEWHLRRAWAPEWPKNSSAVALEQELITQRRLKILGCL